MVINSPPDEAVTRKMQPCKASFVYFQADIRNPMLSRCMDSVSIHAASEPSAILLQV
jgi:hypothetical protein